MKTEQAPVQKIMRVRLPKKPSITAAGITDKQLTIITSAVAWFAGNVLTALKIVDE